MAGELVGQNIHIVSCLEETWGQTPNAPTYVFMPLETYDVKLKRDRRNSNPYLGAFRRKHGTNYRGMPTGSLGGALYGHWPEGLGSSYAEYVVNFAFANPTSNDLLSMCCEQAQGPNVANKRHNGLRFNTFTLQGSQDSGRVEWSADVLGRSESYLETAQEVPVNLYRLPEFEFADVTLSVADSSDGMDIPIASFQLTVSNGLQTHYMNARIPTSLKRTTRQVGFQFVIDKNSKDYDDAARLATDTEYDFTLTLLGLHNGSGSDDYTRLVIDMPRAQLMDPDDNYQVDNYIMTTLPMDILNPDNSDGDIELTWDTV